MFIQTLVPIFSVIALGWLAVRSGYLDRASVAPAGQVVMRIALPALIFLALATAPTGQAFELRFLLVYALGSLLVMGLSYLAARSLLRLTPAEAVVVGLGASMANSAFMGFPIGQALLGPDVSVMVFAHILIVENLFLLPLALVGLALTGGDATHGLRGRLLRDVLRNPLMIALVAGGGVSAVGLSLPAVAHDVLGLLGRLSAPLALLVIGGMLASLPASGRLGAVGVIVGGKLILHPVIMAVGMALVPGISPALALGGVLFAAMPMITIYPLLAARAGQGQLAAFGLVVATSGSFLTLPLVIHHLGLVQP